MSLDTLKQSWQEVNEITILETGQLVQSLDKLTGSELLLIVPHRFGIPLFFDYKISIDGGVTFYPPHQVIASNPTEYMRMFTDDGYLYFDYYGGGLITQCTWRYRLYVIEAKSNG